jgi:hypothetical protein
MFMISCSDGMLRFTGGVMAASFGVYCSAIEMTGGEGFAKVMPAFGFSLVPYLFWIDKVPIFISILKLAKGSNHHGNEPPCWFRHCITFEGLAVGVLLVSQLGFKLLLLGL